VRRGRYAVSVLQMTLVPQERELREIADRMGCVSPLPKLSPAGPDWRGFFVKGTIHSRRQLFANAFMASSRVAA
jgi:hypothetical protein